MKIHHYIKEESFSKLIDAYKNKRPLHLKNALISDAIDSLMSWDQVNGLLRHARLTAPRFRVHKNGTQIPEIDYTAPRSLRRSDGYNKIVVEKLYEVLRNGGTLVIDAIDELCKSLDLFCFYFEQGYSERIQVNAYMSCGTEKGFATHWDDHDVFIFQISGRKNWFLFGNTRRSPLYTDLHTAESNSAPTDIKWNEVISKGDILYIPRGEWHHAIALDEPSLHLTFGINCTTGISFYSWLQEKLTALDIMRDDLPTLSTNQEIKEHDKKIKEAIINTLQSTFLTEYLQSKKITHNSRSYFSLPYAVENQALPKEENFSVRLNVSFIEDLQINTAQNVLTFKSAKKTYSFSLKTKSFFDLMLDYQSHPYQEILNNQDLKKEQLRNLLSSLVISGLATIEH